MNELLTIHEMPSKYRQSLTLGKTPRLIATVPALVLLIHQMPRCFVYRFRDQ